MSRATAKNRVQTLPASLASRVEEVFGQGSPYDMVGLHCLVHLDKPSKPVRQNRVMEFKPDMIFDPSCPHCQPFLSDGAYILYTKDGPFGLRLMANNTYEMVGLTANMNVKEAFRGISRTKN